MFIFLSCMVCFGEAAEVWTESEKMAQIINLFVSASPQNQFCMTLVQVIPAAPASIMQTADSHIFAFKTLICF